jgi:ankyrin repeat protein
MNGIVAWEQESFFMVFTVDRYSPRPGIVSAWNSQKPLAKLTRPPQSVFRPHKQSIPASAAKDGFYQSQASNRPEPSLRSGAAQSEEIAAANQLDEEGRTPLMTAILEAAVASRGHEKAAQKWIAHARQWLKDPALDINAICDQGHTALRYALELNSPLMVDILSRGDANPQKAQFELATLHFAVAHNRPDIFKIFWDPARFSPKEKDVWGGSLLASAIASKNEFFARHLLKHPQVAAEPNQAINTYQTLLKGALAHGNPKIIEMVLALPGLAVNQPDVLSQETPLIMVAKQGDPHHVIDSLLNHPDVDVNQPDAGGVTPLLWALKHNQEGVVYRLLQVPGIDVNQPDAKGQFPLFWAASHGQVQYVEALLEKPRLNLNARNPEGETAYDGATLGAALALRRMMRGQWVPAQEAQENQKLLLKAAQSWKPEPQALRQLLHMPGIQINQGDPHQKTALALAAAAGHQEIVKALLAVKGIAVNQPDTQGNTPLHRAAERGNLPIVQALLLAHADPQIKNQHGNTPIQRATGASKEAIVKMLRQYGATS